MKLQNILTMIIGFLITCSLLEMCHLHQNDNLKDKKILLVSQDQRGIKACEFIRLLRKQGCNVKVVMSNSAQDFIGKPSLAALSDGAKYYESNQSGLEHVKFAEFDAVVILLATANILCKAGSGI